MNGVYKTYWKLLGTLYGFWYLGLRYQVDIPNFPWICPEKCKNMFPLPEVLFHFIKFDCKKRKNPHLFNKDNKAIKHTHMLLRHASHNSAFRMCSLHSTKFEWCTLSAQLILSIARYQPNVRIFGRYLAHRLSTYPRTEITLFQTCLEYNLGYRIC